MATLTVWRFDTVDGARAALATVQRLQKEELIQVLDAAIVSWPEGRRRPKTEQLHDLTRTGALAGAFWGLLFGLIFFVPLLGAAVGAATGALSSAFADVGIDDDFIAEVRQKISPGTSALFAMTQNAVVDRVLSELAPTRAELVSTNLSAEQEARLRAAFADAEAHERV